MSTKDLIPHAKVLRRKIDEALKEFFESTGTQAHIELIFPQRAWVRVDDDEREYRFFPSRVDSISVSHLATGDRLLWKRLGLSSEFDDVVLSESDGSLTSQTTGQTTPSSQSPLSESLPSVAPEHLHAACDPVLPEEGHTNSPAHLEPSLGGQSSTLQGEDPDLSGVRPEGDSLSQHEPEALTCGQGDEGEGGVPISCPRPSGNESVGQAPNPEEQP